MAIKRGVIYKSICGRLLDEGNGFFDSINELRDKYQVGDLYSIQYKDRVLKLTQPEVAYIKSKYQDGVLFQHPNKEFKRVYVKYSDILTKDIEPRLIKQKNNNLNLFNLKEEN